MSKYDLIKVIMFEILTIYEKQFKNQISPEEFELCLKNQYETPMDFILSIW